MRVSPRPWKAASAFIASGALLLAGVVALPAQADAPVQLERLDRGLVAATTEDGVFLSWRLLSEEVTGASATGLTGPSFEIYRNGQLISTVQDITNFLDQDGTGSETYRVVPLVNGVPTGSLGEAAPWSETYLDVPLQRPEGGAIPESVIEGYPTTYTMHANDLSVGDMDGDGEYELVVKWEPDNSKDVSHVGYTGPTIIDTYKLDGTLLNRINLGNNIRSGAHYTQFLVQDFDGDGRSEIMVKTAPGTSVTRYGNKNNALNTKFITMPKADVKAGYKHTDDYRLSAAGYRDHLIEMFQGWDTHERVVSGQWPATLEEALTLDGTLTPPGPFEYPLSQADAGELADFLINVYGPARSGNNKLWNFEGFILDGPEYLTVFEGLTGKELQTIPYNPGRHDDGLMWGDYAMGRIEPGNRVDRFLATSAYLDGSTPSAVFARGYYTRSTLVAYDWNGKNLSERWMVDSGWTPMDNPFNAGPHGTPGENPEFASLTTQGFHSLSAADVDGDGKHEIVYGSSTIDDNGKLLYSSQDVLPPGSGDPGALVGLGHGDAMHVTDIDPTRPGLEIFTVHEGGPWAPYGWAMRDAKDGNVLFGGYTGKDTGRGMIGDINKDVPGMEVWAVGLRSAQGAVLEGRVPGTNMSILWAGDGTRQFIAGSDNANSEGGKVARIQDGAGNNLLVTEGTRTNNWTKGTPGLVADVFGDWREELLVRTTDSESIRIYTSTEPTKIAMYTLMHDSQYRAEVVRQQTSYNQPSYVGFYLASDTDWNTVPVPNAKFTAGLHNAAKPNKSGADQKYKR